jgi:hypothetical protein
MGYPCSCAKSAVGPSAVHQVAQCDQTAPRISRTETCDQSKSFLAAYTGYVGVQFKNLTSVACPPGQRALGSNSQDLADYLIIHRFDIAASRTEVVEF